MKTERALLITLLLITPIFVAWSSPTKAEMTYNYERRWALDSDTGLYWQMNFVPTATFVPSYGMMADGDQVDALFEHVGVHNVFFHDTYGHCFHRFDSRAGPTT
jgi:hypothetical protein